MERARAAAAAALFAILAMSTVALAAVAPRSDAGTLLAEVTWPPASLLLSELQTGGASASDEFVELTNAGPVDIDLAGFEVVYVTSTGGTVTRKATWAASTILGPGRHLLIANSSGVYASVADAVYSGGFAATGGSIVVRPMGGAPTDAVGWGDATSAFVEGVAAAAPAAGRSIERAPGGSQGNSTDTNDNQADWFEQVSPDPQNLAAPAVPVQAASPSPTFFATPSVVPASTTPEPTTSSDASATPAPTVGPSNVPSMGPTAAPTALPSAAPTATPSPTPVSSPSPSPSPSPTDPDRHRHRHPDRVADRLSLRHADTDADVDLEPEPDG